MSLVRQQQRRDTTANWVLYNPVLLDGELGLDTTVDRLKVGDGVTSWDGLPYADRAEDVAADAARAEAAAADAVDISNISTSDDVVEALVAGTAGAGPKTRTALLASFVGTGRQSAEVYDDFTDQANGPIQGRTPDVGEPWEVTGNQPSVVASGAATSTGTGYLVQTLTAAPDHMSCEVAFTTTGGPMTMAAGLLGSGTAEDCIHFNFGPAAFNVTVRRDGGTFDGLAGLNGNWARPVATDGSEVARFSMFIDGDTLIITGPDGITRSCVDPRIGQLAGPVVFWEPNLGARMRSCLAIASADTGQRTVADVALKRGALPVTDGNSRVIGSLGKYGSVAVGYDPATDGPSIDFGPLFIVTALAAPASPGATSIVTRDRVPGLFSLQVDNGDAAEARTATGGASGTGPYTTAISAPLASAHPAGAVVVASIVNSWQHARISFNPDNGALIMPNFLASIIYLAGQTAYVTQAAPGVVELGGAGTGKGGLKTGGGTTAERPNSSAIGPNVQWFDNTLGKPIWSAPGGVWKDATGATV